MFGNVKFRATTNDWMLNTTIFDDAIKTLENNVRIDRTHTIPYVAGYSLNGKVIYIDHRMPKGYYNGSRFIFTDRYIILHEVIEAGLLIQFPGLNYIFSHQVALRVEKDAVINDRIDWIQYNNFCDKYIKLIGNAPAMDVPKALDLQPYRNEKDFKTLDRMQFRK